MARRHPLAHRPVVNYSSVALSCADRLRVATSPHLNSAFDRVHGQLLEVRVLLADADEHDGLARLVGHTEGGAHFVVDRIELGQY